MPEKCALCGNVTLELARLNVGGDLYHHKCGICGEYISGRLFQTILGGHTLDQKAKISAYLVERKLNKLPAILLYNKQSDIPNEINSPVAGLDFIVDSFPVDLQERLNRALLNLYKCHVYLGMGIKYDPVTYYSLFLGLHAKEAVFIAEHLRDSGYIKILNTHIVFTPKGISYVLELVNSRYGIANKQVFVAMSFANSMDDAYHNGIFKALKEDCGFEPFRVDMHEHNGKIDDLIISEIRKSKFVVADLTLHRAGVYFEAGLMMGMNRPVIFTVREDDADNTHFDTRQYNQIRWGSPEDLRIQLKRRIQATIF